MHPLCPLAAATRTLACLALCAASAYAGEAFASAGWRGSGGKGASWSGAAARAGIGWRWSSKSGIEGEFGAFTKLARHNIVTGSAREGSVSLVRHFGKDRVEPYVLGGGGVIHYAATPLLGRRTTALGYQLHGAFGIKGWVSKRLCVRPEARFAAGSFGHARDLSEPPLWGLSLTIGLGYRW